MRAPASVDNWERWGLNSKGPSVGAFRMPPAGAQKGCILVVDDEDELRDLLGYILTSKGYQVMLARGGNDALKQLKVADVDVIVSDIRMPDGDGLSLLDA